MTQYQTCNVTVISYWDIDSKGNPILKHKISKITLEKNNE